MSQPELIASRYRVVRELGRGGMGVVYIVEHLRTGDQVALKLLYGRAATDPQSLVRFQREARASARIKSEHVVKVFDADVAPELGNAPFLVMELLNGSDLKEMVEIHGRLPPEQLFGYLAQVARALDKAHSAGIVHRDLKPENLFVHHREDGSEVVKILDFGISKLVAAEAAGDIAGASMTKTGDIMGTPLYMAPEQARGRVSEVAPTTDVWAIGLVTLHLLTGEIYWNANTIAELMVQILSDPMPPPSQRWPFLPPALDAWFARSCARLPEERFGSVGEQVAALGMVLGVSAPLEHAVSASYRASSAMALPTGMTSGAPPAVGSTTAAVASPTASPVERRTSHVPILAAVIAVLALGGGATALLLHSRSAAQPAAAASSADNTSTTLPARAAAPVATTSAVPPATSASAGAPEVAVAPAKNEADAGAPNAAHQKRASARRAVHAAPPKPHVAANSPHRRPRTSHTATRTTHTAKAFDPAAP